jgi:LmbE family N-acetylglucosaminyl deacetylase
MLSLSLAGESEAPIEVLCVGAHCDDLEIGCGGLLMELQRARPKLRIHGLILSSTMARRREAESAWRSMVRRSARGVFRVHEHPDGALPAHLVAVKRDFAEMRAVVSPALILTHHERDRHQDHRLVCEVTWQTFRDHMIWEYEIPKYDADLLSPNMYVPLSAAMAARKVRLLARSYASQRSKSWFQNENFLALLRLRGLECRAPSGFAEGFHCRKAVWSPLADGAPENSRVNRARGSALRRRQ